MCVWCSWKDLDGPLDEISFIKFGFRMWEILNFICVIFIQTYET